MQENTTVQHSFPDNAISLSSSGFMQRVYLWMCAGLAATGLVAYFVSTSREAISLIFGTPGVFYGLLIAELLAVVFFISVVSRVRPGTAALIFLFYAVLNGITFSSIFLVFELGSIGMTFAITAGMFGIMSIYGYLTKTDLTTVGNLAFMGLVGIILASLLNLFLNNETIDWVVSYIGVVIFVALTAYDTQKIKQYAIGTSESSDEGRKGSIIGALSLYLDFVNLFLMLLRISGRRR